MQVTAAYAKANLSQLLRAVEAGETVEITRNNKAIAALVPGPAASPTTKLARLDAARPMSDQQIRRFIDEGRY